MTVHASTRTFEPIPEITDAYVVHIPHQNRRFGAVHEPALTDALNQLGPVSLAQLDVRTEEIAYPGAVSDVEAYPFATLLIVNVGRIRAVLVRTTRNTVTTAKLDLVPTRGLLIPARTGFGYQSQVSNRVGVTIFRRRSASVWSMPASDGLLADLWDPDMRERPRNHAI